MGKYVDKICKKESRVPSSLHWQAEIVYFPIGLLSGVAVFLTPGHPWSISAFSPEVWGIWGALLFGVNFTVISIAVWRTVMLIGRVVRCRVKPAGVSDVWDSELDG